MEYRQLSDAPFGRVAQTDRLKDEERGYNSSLGWPGATRPLRLSRPTRRDGARDSAHGSDPVRSPAADRFGPGRVRPGRARGAGPVGAGTDGVARLGVCR